MKFITFVWVNSLAVAFALLVLSLDQQELILLCTNTNTQRSSLLDGQMITSQGSVDTFGTAIVVTGTSSLELKYPAVEPKNVGNFDVIASGDDFVLSQSNSGSRLSTFKLFRASGHWWGQLIENDYRVSKSAYVVTKSYYCVGLRAA
jgi:hypothetical protein